MVERDVVDEAPVGAVEERHRGEARRAPLGEAAGQEPERQTGVDDVLDEQHVATGDWPVEVLEQAHAAARATAAVRRQLDHVELVVDLERTGEVGEEDGARLERRDEDRKAAGVGGGELAAELLDTDRDLLATEVDLADRVALGAEPLRLGHEAIRSRYRCARRSMSRR